MLIYNDTSFDDKTAGIACVASNDKGETIAIKTSFKCATDIVEAELLALEEGAKLAIEISGDESAVLISDNLSAVDFLLGRGRVPYQHKKLVKRIKKMLGNNKVKWINRDENLLADALAVLVSRRNEIREKDTPGTIIFDI